MQIDLLLVGFGNVGRRFARLLDERRERLERNHGLHPRIVGIATGRRGALFEPHGVDVARAVDADARLGPLANGLELIAAAAETTGASPRVVVETTPLNIETARPAIDHVRLALGSRLHVISANKGPVAFAYRGLRDLAQRMGVQYLFEGAVMDGVPIFNLVRETMPAVAITGFRGVVNSTTNYIITMLEEGGELAPALAEMQRQGIAEADASLDVDGWDAAAKTAALVNVLMDGSITPRDVDRTGIGQLTGESVREAAARGRPIRLVASARLDGGAIAARVAPEGLGRDDPLSLLRGMSNALYLESDLLGRIGITQMDGGLTQTAYALLADLVTLGRSLGARPSGRPDRSP
jgi:homoserine dehydrogenase